MKTKVVGNQGKYRIMYEDGTFVKDVLKRFFFPPIWETDDLQAALDYCSGLNKLYNPWEDVV